MDDLPTAHLEYSLRNGTVGDWLVLGPLTTPLPDPKILQSSEARRRTLNSVLVDVNEIAQLPAERATSVVTVAEGSTQPGMWRVVNTLDDGWVDLAQHVSVPSTLCAWAYAQVVLQEGGATSLLLTTASPTQVWINSEAVFGYDALPDQPVTMRVMATLQEGSNEILVRIANVGAGAVPMVLAVQIDGAEGTVTLPTLLEPVARRQKLATVMGHAYLAQDVYSGQQRIVLRWPTDMQMIDALTARLQSPAGRIFGEANPMVQRGAKVDFGEAAQFPDGDYEILLQPQFEEFYVQDMRVQRRIPLHIRNGKWSFVYYGGQTERRQEALADAAKRSGIYAEIAKSALGKWGALRHEVLEQALASLLPGTSGSEISLLGLLGWVARSGDLPDFPAEVAWALEERAPLVLNGLEKTSDVALVTCHLLAGQLYPHRSFADGHFGEWHQAHAEEWFGEWLHTTAQQGLPQGESETSIAHALLALSHLVDLAHDDEVAELAAVVLDKLAYQMALQSFLGAWGGCQDVQGRWQPSARLGPLSGVARLWWGQGAFAADCAATVALACAESYTLPEIIAAVGLDRQQDNDLRRQDISRALGDSCAVNRRAFRTGDYLLASVQGDWDAGGSGVLWQVTLGPDALITGNRPANASTHAAWQQNYWQGNAAPVRVAQWQDWLAMAYGPTERHALPYSHAYFPKGIFDEVWVENGWAMARKGNGYVALTATGGVDMVVAGPTAQREVRAAGEAVWLVQMGRAASDGTFSDFVQKVLAQPLTLNSGSVEMTTLRGQTMQFRAAVPLDDALRVDGVPQPLQGFPHLESIYGGAAAIPANAVEIQYQEHRMRLDFGMAEGQTAG